MRDRRRRRRRLRRKGAWRRSIPGNKILTFFLTCLSSSGCSENLRGATRCGVSGRRGGKGKGRATEIRRREERGIREILYTSRRPGTMVCALSLSVPVARPPRYNRAHLTWDLHTLPPLPSLARGSEKNGWTRENIPKVWMPAGILFHVGSTTGGEEGGRVIENPLITFLERRKISLDLFLEDWSKCRGEFLVWQIIRYLVIDWRGINFLKSWDLIL